MGSEMCIRDRYLPEGPLDKTVTTSQHILESDKNRNVNVAAAKYNIYYILYVVICVPLGFSLPTAILPSLVHASSNSNKQKKKTFLHLLNELKRMDIAFCYIRNI